MPPSPGECWSLRPQPRKLPARQAPHLGLSHPSSTSPLSPHHSPRCSGGRRPGRTHLTKSDTSVLRSQTSPSESLALAWPPTLRVSPPQTYRGSRSGRGAVTEISPVFSPVKWVRRPGLLTGLPSLEVQCWGVVSRPGSPGPPELVLGIAEALRHKVDGLVGLVLVGLHGRCIRVEGPDLGLLGKGVLAGGGGAGLSGPEATGAPGPDSHPPAPWGSSRGLGTVRMGRGRGCFFRPPVGQPPAQPPGWPESRRMAKMALSARTWPSPSLGGGSHQELPVGGQQPRSVGLHFSILFAQPKLHGEPVQLMGSAGDAAVSTADLLTKAPAPRPAPLPGQS